MLMPTVTHRQIAEAAGVSTAAVSHAFKGSPHVSDKTRQRILRTAEQLGYQPNAMVNALMSHIRRSKIKHTATPLALLDFEGALNYMATYEYSQFLLEGMERQAQTLGYRLERFPFENTPRGGQRLEKILQYRAIQGVIVPMTNRLPHDIHFNADRFATVALGYSAHVQGHAYRVAPDQFRNTKLAVEKMLALGYRRIGLYQNAASDQRVDGHFSAPFLQVMLGEDNFERLQDSVFLFPEFDGAGLVDWVRRLRLDAVLSCTPQIVPFLKESGIRVPQDVGVALLSWAPAQKDFAGMDQSSEVVGSTAINLLVAQINRNERSSASTEATTLIPGEWKMGRTLKRQEKRRRA